MTEALSRELAAVAERIAASTVAVRIPRAGGGAGVVWSNDGAIVTNAHVARGREAVVVLPGGSETPARIERRDAERDLALLRVDARDLVPAQIRSTRDLRPGELLVAVGHPHGERGVSTGIAHAELHGGRRYVAADVRLAPGNSGGPLADARGLVVGINSMVASGLALAIPSDVVTRFIGDRQSERLRFGIRMTPARFAGAPALVVVDVEDASPAERAGVSAGDVIVAIDGRSVVRRGWETAERAMRLEIRRGSRPLVIVVDRGAPGIAA